MPNFAFIQVRNLLCPQCFNEITDNNLVGFQWGYCRGRIAYGPDYQLGDTIKWRVGKDRIGHKWSYFKRGGDNIGDPNYFNLLVRETEWGLRKCPSCDFEFAGIGIRIEGGVIKDVHVYLDGLPEADISIIDEDGSLHPKPEWDDHSMSLVDGGWFARLVLQTELV